MNRDVICPAQDAAFGAQTVAYTGTAGTLTGWKPGPNAVWLYCSTAAYVRVGEGVTATTADFPVVANDPVILDVPPGTGATWTVSAIQTATGGALFAKPITR